MSWLYQQYFFSDALLFDRRPCSRLVEPDLRNAVSGLFHSRIIPVAYWTKLCSKSV